MKKPIRHFTRFLSALAALALLSAGASTQAGIISVNLTEFASDVQQINSDETFGIASQDSVVGGWVNLNQTLTANNLAFSDGTASSVGMSGTAPNQWATFNAAYDDTPLRAGIDDYVGTPNPTAITLTGLAASFPLGYKVIVYVGGFNALTKASISDGTTTFYYRPLNPPVAPVTFVQTTDTVGTTPPVAQYAVFGESTALTTNTLTLTLDTPGSGGSGLCGFQIIGTTSTELTARIWKGNLSSDWDTATFNWTNVFYGATNYADGDPTFFTDAAVAANPTVNLTATRSPGSLTVDSTKNYTFTGSGIAGATSLAKKGQGSLTLSNPNTYTGNTVISAGTLKIGVGGSIPDGTGAGDVSVASGATLDLNGNSDGINGLSGTGTVDNTGGSATLTVGLNNDGGTFPGTIQGAAGLTKQGTGTLTLTGTNSHTGPTTVAQGTLVLSPLSAFSPDSALVVSNGANLEVSFTNSSYALSTSGSISFTGGTGLTVDYGDASATASTTPITTSGALNLNGVTQIGILGENFGIGTYTIISYGSKTGGGSISATPAFLPGGMAATIQDTGSAINLLVTTASVNSLLWTQGDGEWSTNSSLLYWNTGTKAYQEYPSGTGDIVTFNTANFGTVNLPHDVHPYAVTVGGDYVLNGPGSITGATGLTRSGDTTTTFTLNNANTYTGVTAINQGNLQINNASALGSTAGGTVVASGGSLVLSNGITLSGEPLTLNGNGVGSANLGALRTSDTNAIITVASPITLGSNARIRPADGGEMVITGPITDNGSNYTVFLHAGQSNTVLRLASSGNVAGDLTVYGNTASLGLIRFDVNDVFPGSSLTLGGGLFDLNGKNQNFAGLLAGFNPTQGVLTNSSATPATLTINYAGTNASAQTQSALSGLINVVKEGVGVQSFGGGSGIAHSYSGTTTINGGVFGVSSDFSRVTNSFVVNNGGTLRGSGNPIGGPVTVNPGGTLYAGFASNAIGELTISNSLALAGSTIVALNKDASPSNDVVNVTGGLTYGGTLRVLNIGSNLLAVGDTFTVFPSGGSSSFGSIVTDPGVNVSFNGLTGVITVTGVSAPPLTYTRLGGGVVEFDWSGPYKLQWQTNTLSAGLKTNWVDYPDTSKPVYVTNSPAIPASFFRLKAVAAP